MIRAREVSCVEATESVLERIAQHNGRINAIVVDYGEDALNALPSRRTGRSPAAPPSGRIARGPRHHQGEYRCRRAGDTERPAHLRRCHRAGSFPGDAQPARRRRHRRRAHQHARAFHARETTDNPLRGRTLNPWDEETSPGGSSGGASAAAAMGFGPIHHGNDIGGSLRFPSFACGLATVKPTLGRVPAYNPSAAAERGLLAQLMSVQGAICREVRDVRLATRALAAGDPRDPWWVPVPFDGPALDPPIKVAVTTETHDYPINPQIVAGIERAADVLSDAGYAVERVGDAVDHGGRAGVVRRARQRDRPLPGPEPRASTAAKPCRPSSRTTSAWGTLSMRPDTARPSPLAPR